MVIKIGILSEISKEWLYLYKDIIELTTNVEEAKYIIYESNGDPIDKILKIKQHYPKNKLIFILSGDQSSFIDDECIWFCNSTKSNTLALKQTQIYVTNPAIFKYYSYNNTHLNNSINNKNIDIYFKGTIWEGLRKDMYNYFKDKKNCVIIQNNNYWNWRTRANQSDIENEAFDEYNNISKCKLCLCPKGNGNSSMRIIEALACKAIPILINDTSKPFNNSWQHVALCFNINIFNNNINDNNDWEYIYKECINLLNNKELYNKMLKNGSDMFENIIFSDKKNKNFKMYNNINTVCFGFSNLIINKILT